MYWTISKFSIRSLFYDYFVFFDTMPYLADQLFIRHKIKTEELLNYTNSYARRVNMIYTPDTKKAIKLCFEAHKGQVDKSGAVYIFHPIRVAERCTTEEEKIVALLHDTIEDTSVTPEYLLKQVFPRTIVDAVLGVSRRDDETYEEFVRRASLNPVSKQSH